MLFKVLSLEISTLWITKFWKWCICIYLTKIWTSKLCSLLTLYNISTDSQYQKSTLQNQVWFFSSWTPLRLKWWNHSTPTRKEGDNSTNCGKNLSQDPVCLELDHWSAWYYKPSHQGESSCKYYACYPQWHQLLFRKTLLRTTTCDCHWKHSWHMPHKGPVLFWLQLLLWPQAPMGQR